MNNRDPEMQPQGRLKPSDCPCFMAEDLNNDAIVNVSDRANPRGPPSCALKWILKDSCGICYAYSRGPCHPQVDDILQVLASFNVASDGTC
jgi:hypothetical protein